MIRFDPPLSREEKAIITGISLAAMLLGYAFGKLIGFGLPL
jgi:hypothetical protein